MKWRVVLFLLSTTLLLGCFPVGVEKPKPEPQHTSQVNRPVQVGLWQFTLKPKVEEPTHPGFVTYNIDFTYQGDTKVKLAKLSAGNGTLEMHDISRGEGGMLGSTYPLGTKRIDLQLTSSDANGETSIQSFELFTGE